jgi:hypothetical protein
MPVNISTRRFDNDMMNRNFVEVNLDLQAYVTFWLNNMNQCQRTLTTYNRHSVGRYECNEARQTPQQTHSELELCL